MSYNLNLTCFISLVALCTFIAPGKACAADHSKDSAVYTRHVKHVIKEHRKLNRHLYKLSKKAASDSASSACYHELAAAYHRGSADFSYLEEKRRRSYSGAQYNESVTHLGLIEKTYRQLQKTNRDDNKRLLAMGKLKEAKMLQKQAFYSNGRYRYFKKNVAGKLFEKINLKNIEALKQSQQFITTVQNPAASLKSMAPIPQLPKVQLPESLQTNAEVNKVFAHDKAATGTSKQQKFQHAISNPLQSMIDTSRSKDSLLFKPNPYRFMPLAHRIKAGGNTSMGDLLAGGRKISYALQVQYLWMPQIKPVLAIVYEHGLVNRSGRWSAPAVNWQIRVGAEIKGYKMISVFANYERSYSVNDRLNERPAGQHEFVLGLTNDTGKKRMLKLWAGIRLRELAMRHASPFVFRVGF